MADLKNVVAYLVTHYPHKNELSKARLTKMIYLADWKSTLDRGEPITDISWKFNHYGPYVDDIYKLALDDPNFEVQSELNRYGHLKERIVMKSKNIDIRVSDEEASILDHVIEQTRRLTWDPFIKLVYSTYPVLSGTRGEKLDLLKAAQQYRNVKAHFARS